MKLPLFDSSVITLKATDSGGWQMTLAAEPSRVPGTETKTFTVALTNKDDLMEALKIVLPAYPIDIGDLPDMDDDELPDEADREWHAAEDLREAQMAEAKLSRMMERLARKKQAQKREDDLIEALMKADEGQAASPAWWIPPTTPEERRQMTLGQYRVGIEFNPSGDATVHKIKHIAAALIDAIASITTNPSVGADAMSDEALDNGFEIARLKARAMDEIETGAMCAVKAATKHPLGS